MGGCEHSPGMVLGGRLRASHSYGVLITFMVVLLIATALAGRVADQAEPRAEIPSSSTKARTRSPMSSLIGRTRSTDRSLGSPTSQSR
jgi:hypothetical protein